MTLMIRFGGSAIAGAFGASVMCSAAQADPGDGRYRDHYGMMGWGDWLSGPVVMLLFFALLAGAVVLVVRFLGSDAPKPGAKQEDRSHAILRERFAKGEITKEEFEASRTVLDGDAS
jgi:putative membrane protein